ncbi:MAG: phosphohistidine phosphatase SixA [Candidatus Omnitrophota bacterium]|nr:phosphohistidine phosphatase SixA [Candidatus Omnitrophota bacterium]
MKLYLMRHGEAVSDHVDPQRPLSERGRAQTASVAAYLRQTGIKLQEVWHSTELRAKETAEGLVRVMELPLSCQEKKGLAPNDPAGPVADLLQEYAIHHPDGSIMLVSHLPFLPNLVEILLSTETQRGSVRFGEAGTLCLGCGADDTWSLDWAIEPEEVR